MRAWVLVAALGLWAAPASVSAHQKSVSYSKWTLLDDGAVAQVTHRSLGGDKPVKKTRKPRGPHDRERIDRRPRTFEDAKWAPTRRRLSHNRQRVQKQRPAPPM